jgi:hypothetical protein
MGFSAVVGFIACARHKTACQLKSALYFARRDQFEAAISRFDCRFWDNLFRRFAFGSCPSGRNDRAAAAR